MTAIGLALRLLLTLLLAALLLAGVSAIAYLAGWRLFGLTGHPAAPDVPAFVYASYAIAAPILCLGGAAWLVFRKRGG